MSWMSDNYEKAALGGSALVALALVFFGWSAANGVDDELQNPVTGRGDDNTAVPGAEEIPRTISAMEAGHQWNQATLKDRPLDLFTGIALFAKRGEKEPVDLWTAAPIHPPIPNRWFLDYRIDIGFADSPARDPDGDGFSNLEEFQAKTDPSDAKSHPPLIAKLSYVGQDVVQWLVRWSSEVGDKSTFKCRDSHYPGKDFGMRVEDAVGPGDILKFADLRKVKCPLDNRFKLIEIQERTVRNERLKTDEVKSFAIMEDLKPNKMGDRFEIPRRVTQAQLPSLIHFDRTAVFELKAAGNQGKKFKVEERTAFSLPPGAEKKPFFLKEVTDEKVTVEVRDGSGAVKETLVIPMNGFPKIDLTTFKSE